MPDPVYRKNWPSLERLFLRNAEKQDPANAVAMADKPRFLSTLREISKWPIVLFGLNAILMTFSSLICDKIPSMSNGHPSGSTVFVAFYLIVLAAQFVLSIVFIIARTSFVFSRLNRENAKSLD